MNATRVLEFRIRWIANFPSVDMFAYVLKYSQEGRPAPEIADPSPAQQDATTTA